MEFWTLSNGVQQTLAQRLVEMVTVYDEKLVIEFKSGMAIEVEA